MSAKPRSSTMTTTMFGEPSGAVGRGGHHPSEPANVRPTRPWKPAYGAVSSSSSCCSAIGADYHNGRPLRAFAGPHLDGADPASEEAGSTDAVELRGTSDGVDPSRTGKGPSRRRRTRGPRTG